jgi:phosphomannomutase
MQDKKQIIEKIVKAYDIRGIVPDELNEEIAHEFGMAFGTFIDQDTIVVGRDMRVSSEPLATAFIDGVNSVGVNVIDIGLASTDMLYFGSGHFNIPGAMFTASHNPAQYNGIKLCLAGAKPVGQDTGLANIKDLVLSEKLRPSIHKGSHDKTDLLKEFALHVQSFIDVNKLRPLKVVADTANGMGGLIVPAVFKDLPFELEILFQELDGSFPNHPADPIQPENLKHLIKRVIQTGADVGLAFDGDADRVFLVDDQGNFLDGSTTTAIVAHAMLSKYPNSKILYNAICSKAVKEIIAENGGIGIVTRVGHSFIKQKMAETNAVFAGEHSGHYYFLKNYRADSGIIAALVVLELLSVSDKKLSELRKPYQRYVSSGEINKEVDDPKAIVNEIEEIVNRWDVCIDKIDGLTVDLGNWWFNVRPSNTEPLLRINIEAESGVLLEQARRKVDELIEDVTKKKSKGE